jgi:hypothetical protein
MFAEDPMGAGGRLAESCASVLPYAMGRRALLFLVAGHRRAQRSATHERSFQECNLADLKIDFRNDFWPSMKKWLSSGDF